MRMALQKNKLCAAPNPAWVVTTPAHVEVAKNIKSAVALRYIFLGKGNKALSFPQLSFLFYTLPFIYLSSFI